MNNKYILLFQCSLVALLLLSCKKEKMDMSKGFIKYFGGIDMDEASDMQQTSDGGYIIIGTTQSKGRTGTDMYVVKTDAGGNEEWSKTFGDVLNDEGSALQQTSDGGYIFIGTYRYTIAGIDSNKTDVLLVKTKSSGETEWTKKIGYSGTNEQGISVRQTTDGGYILAGNTDAVNDGDLIVYKVNSAGEEEQPITRHPASASPGLDESINILQRADGGYVLSSYTSRQISPVIIFIDNYPITSAPNAPTKDVFFETSMQTAGEVALSPDGEFVLTGKTLDEDLFVIKFKNSKTNPKTWFKTYGGTGIDIGSSIQATPDGGYIILGSTTSSGAGSQDIYLLKVNSSGEVIWEKTFGGKGLDVGKVVRNTSDGGYAILGTVEFGDDPSTKDNIISLIKVNSKGEIEN